MRVIICGSRGELSSADRVQVQRVLEATAILADALDQNLQVVIEDEANEVELFAAQWARRRDIPALRTARRPWADMCVAFVTDEPSRNVPMVDTATQHGIPTHVVFLGGGQ